MRILESALGTWCSGITSAPHAEGPGLKSQCVHLFEANKSKQANYCHSAVSFLSGVRMGLEPGKGVEGEGEDGGAARCGSGGEGGGLGVKVQMGTGDWGLGGGRAWSKGGDGDWAGGAGSKDGDGDWGERGWE